MLILSTPENERGPKPSFLVGDAAYACNDRVITHVTRLLQPADALMKTVSVSSTLTSAWKEIEWAFGVLVHRRGTLQHRCAPTPTRANTETRQHQHQHAPTSARANTNTRQHQHAPTPTRANTNTREPTPTRSKANSRQQRHARERTNTAPTTNNNAHIDLYKMYSMGIQALLLVLPHSRHPSPTPASKPSLSQPVSQSVTQWEGERRRLLKQSPHTHTQSLSGW